MLLSDVSLSVAYIGPNTITERPRKTKIGTKIAHATQVLDTTFKVKRSKVKVTRPLYSPPCWRVRRLQRWAWERVGRGKLLLRCRLLGGERRFGAHGGGGAEAYRGGRPPTACYHVMTWIASWYFLAGLGESLLIYKVSYTIDSYQLVLTELELFYKEN